MSTSEELIVAEESDESIRFTNKVDSSRDAIERLLTSLGHVITPESWAEAAQESSGRIILCANESCRKLFTMHVQLNKQGGRGPHLAPKIVGIWEIRRLEVRDHDEHLYSRPGLTIVIDEKYKIADLKRQLPKHFLCNRYLNLL